MKKTETTGSKKQGVVKRPKVVWSKGASESMTDELLKEKLGNKITITASYKSKEVRIDPNLDEEIQKITKLRANGSGYDLLEQVRELFFDDPLTAKRAAGIARRLKGALPKVKVVLYRHDC